MSDFYDDGGVFRTLKNDEIRETLYERKQWRHSEL